MTLFLVFGCLLAVWVYFQMRQASRERKADFEAALALLEVGSYELLLDKMMPSNGNSAHQTYRILRSSDDRYFLYLHTPKSPGVLKPLTKERALLAAKLNS
ncbi:hypothetical protein [Pseudomonas sp. GV071]|uniref:hypothetical protein n=1 Tax=Pseudomonas sp. GV071 TaxID=2135754 RepID=UPI000D3D3E5A|nr:hypothetical protein [Pseudomonas sp. GV071]PTQ74142.1 hypothetical protein C8K61_101582 [Pseudomonas sp. GV071]